MNYWIKKRINIPFTSQLFTATFVAVILNRGGVRDAHKQAVAVSAYICTQNGVMTQILDYLK